MSSIIFHIFHSVTWIITLLPIRVLYFLSAPVYFFICCFPGYRKKVVMTNLRNSFPEKTDIELKAIQKKFYRHLTDLFVETLKVNHMSRAEMKKRMTFENPELIRRLYDERRDIAAVLGHYNNWEWLSIISELSDHKHICIYKPLKNRHFNDYLNSLRTKFGIFLSPMSMIIRDLITCRKNGTPALAAFLADQTPARGDIHHWTTFLNQETAVFLGAGKIASKYNMAVVFFNIKKVKRGYYSLKTELLVENASTMSEKEITELHVKRLDEIIREKPEYWIWSHRRWKHKREQ